jgi:hypothetical protein
MKTKNTNRNIESLFDLDLDTPEDNYLDKYNQLLRILKSQVLVKACYDEFDYALKLRTGEIIGFKTVRVISDEWIHVKLDDSCAAKNPFPFEVDRGMDIRISDIVWVMDAPNGS